MSNVKIIAPTATPKDMLRVAAYCRVSSDSADQLHSYAAQIKAYTRLIDEHDGWELVDIYADEGLTGTRMDKREDFQRLMYDCRKGKIDKVVVKSISRFARNTRDCLVTLRELSSLGVTVKFEKENIDTGNAHLRIDGERFRHSGPGGIHLHLEEPANQLPAEDGTGRVHHLQSSLRISAGGTEKIWRSSRRKLLM